MDWTAEIKKLTVVSYEHHNEFGDEDSDDAYLKVQVDDLLKRMLESFSDKCTIKVPENACSRDDRKELKSYSSDHIRCVANNCDNDDPCFWEEFYIKAEADAVLASKDSRIRELEDKIHVLEKQSEVSDRMLQDMTNNREFVPDSNNRIKEN